MLDPKHIDDLTRRLAGSLPKGLQALQDDIQRNLRAALEAGLAKLDLVTREELDVQAAVLARTREKVTRLEEQVAELEARLGGATPPPAKKPTARRTPKKSA
jgi:BMFP domain-containing protein YqiC